MTLRSLWTALGHVLLALAMGLLLWAFTIV